MDALGVGLGRRIVFEADPAGGELVDRPLDVLDDEVEDGERRRGVVGLG
jgi:hypothetical protein